MALVSLFGPTTTDVPAEDSLGSIGWDVTVPLSTEIVCPAAQLLEQPLPVKEVQAPTVSPFPQAKPHSKPVLPEPKVTPTVLPGVTYAEALRRSKDQARMQYGNRIQARTQDVAIDWRAPPGAGMDWGFGVGPSWADDTQQNRALTQNGAEAYRSTESVLLDAFSSLNARSSAYDIHRHLTACWQQSPEQTLRIIWNMRSIHEGHSNKIGFYHAFGWLYNYHPRTAIGNLQSVVERLCERTIKHKPRKDVQGFEIVDAEETPAEEVIKMPHGYYKDLLNIVVLAMRGELGDSRAGGFNSLNVPLVSRTTRTKAEWVLIKRTKWRQNKNLGVQEAQKLRAEASKQADTNRAEKAKAERRTKRESSFEMLKSKLESDKSFLVLYATVAQIFADVLGNDVALLKRIETASKEEAFKLQFELTSASKWAPSLDGFHDRATNISTAIALVMHARGHMSDLPLSLSGELTQENAHTLRSYYRRWVVSPLRRFADVTEVKMSARKWDEVDYRHVPSECMKANMGNFFNHDEKRLTNYLGDVEAGKSKISGATLLPHELLIEALKLTPESSSDRGRPPTRGRPSGRGQPSGRGRTRVTPVAPAKPATPSTEQRLKEAKASVKHKLTGGSQSKRRIIEAQWNSLLERMRESGKLESSLAIVDVSGSMGSINSLPAKKNSNVQPIFPAVALGLLLAQLAQPPFKNMFITFSATPKLWTVQPGGLAEQARQMVRAEWGMNTNYEAVFLDLLLPIALKNKIKPEDMIKRLFVFSDMQFDASVTERSGRGWTTTHNRIVKAYKRAGYEVPEIVYWDLQGTTKPVLKDTRGTALLTGFSANMIKLFMEGEIVGEEPVEIGHDGEEVKKEAITPLAIMEKALSKACYNTLKVYD
ncbi:hypothetical protein FRC10_001206 [Ceratobasidium sp. 414]|nr:hypothetical protein FRC10_001206 [Ceratobasidium sp. 414]